MLPRIISVKLQYLKLFAKIELLVLHRNTWNHLIMSKLMSNVE